jgi:hypothetical protein
MPLENEYNISEVKVSEDCLALSNPVAVMSLIVAKAETLMIEAEISPTVINPVAVRLLTVVRAPILTVPLNVILADDTTTPEFFKYRASV